MTGEERERLLSIKSGKFGDLQLLVDEAQHRLDVLKQKSFAHVCCSFHAPST